MCRAPLSEEPDAADAGSLATHDIFLSYAHADRRLAQALKIALEGEGLTVWFDENEVEDLTSISAAVARGLSYSKALVAIYSETYPTRRACQHELTAAFLAAQRLGDPRERVLVVNPDGVPGHIEPIELRDAKYLVATEADSETIRPTAEALASRVRKLEGPLEAGPPLATRWLPAPRADSPRFVGRMRDFWAIHSALHSSDTPMVAAQTQPIAQIRGLGGIGKSLLAEEYARRFAAAFPGGVFWLGAAAETEQGLLDRSERDAERHRQLRALAERLGVATEDRSPEAVAGLLADRLHAAGPYLWVVDDLSAEIALEEARAWFAPSVNGRTLVVSRGELSGLPLAVVVEPLPEAEALALLTGRRLPDDEQEWDAAMEIVSLLGGHPQALEITGAALWAQAGIGSFGETAVALRSPGPDELELAARLAGELPNGHEPSIAATLLRSIKLLTEPGRDLLRLAASIGAVPFPARFVSATLRSADRLDRRAAQHQAALGVRDGAQHSLVRQAPDGGLLVHILVSRVVRLTDEQPERQGLLRRATVHVIAAELAPLAERRANELASEVVEHARQLVTAPTDRRELDLLTGVGVYDLHRGDYASARQAFTRAHTRAQLLFGDDDELTVLALSNLAVVQRYTGDLRGALALQDHALAVLQRSRLSGGAVFVLLTNIGDTLRVLGAFDAARGFQEQIAEAAERLGLPELDQLGAQGNLALTLDDQGEHERALEIGRHVLLRRRELLGERHIDTVVSMNNVALTLQRLSRSAEAEPLAREAVQRSEETLGDAHRDTLIRRANLVLVLADEGKFAEAEELGRSIIELADHAPGCREPVAAATENLGVLLLESGRPDEAKALLLKALEEHRKIMGPDAPRTVIALDNLASAYKSTGEAALLLTTLSECFERSSRTLGNHSLTLSRLQRLCSAMIDAGRPELATAALQMLVQAYTEKHGAGEPRSLAAREELARSLQAIGAADDALELRETNAALSAQTMGPHDSFTLTLRNQLAVTLLAVGRLDEAESVLDEILASPNDPSEERDGETLTAQVNLASVYFSKRRFEDAREIEYEVLQIRRSKLGESDPRTVRLALDYAETLIHCGANPADVRTLRERTFAAALGGLDPDHPLTLKALDALVASLGHDGDHGRVREVVMDHAERMGSPELGEEFLQEFEQGLGGQSR